MENKENRVLVVGVRFRSAGKTYFFDPGELVCEIGEEVIVETARGLEFGYVFLANETVSESDIIAPLKPIIRKATDEDRKRHEENEAKKEKSLKLCQEKIDKHNLEMKLIDVEYTFDNQKIIFYFTADGRVDFRELVKDLASVFKMRIELRQIGVRDEAKMMGGVGICGRGLCCASWLSDFEPVSIKMAKTQNMSLNPSKISGICSRLMCCLKYENDVYLELRKGMPEVGEVVQTREGRAKVFETNILEGKIKARLYTGEMDEDGEEKLSSDIYEYEKRDIRRLGKRPDKKEDKNDDLAGLSEEEIKEIKALMKED